MWNHHTAHGIHRPMFLSRMQVVKRDGRRERVSFDKIIIRTEGICMRKGLKRIDPIEVAKETVQGLKDGIKTEELDEYAARKCAEMMSYDPEYGELAAGLSVSNLHKMTSDDFMEVTEELYKNDPPLVTEEYYNCVKTNKNRIQEAINYERDYKFNFFGIKTLERAYLLRTKRGIDVRVRSKDGKKYGKIVERPQHMIMRVALGIHMDEIEAVIETYNLMSKHYFTHASPTLYNAGSPNPQLASCYLMAMVDSIEGIYKTISDAAVVSKWSGGIGIGISPIRAKNSLIRGTNGYSDGIMPLIRVLNETARYVNQGGRRNGAIACYLEPWHADVFEFCEVRKNRGTEELRARDIFVGLWIPDLFMKRVKKDGVWSLMCPNECKGLVDSYGEEFEEKYIAYEKEGRYRTQIRAKELWFHILDCQIETGLPYMLFKDHCNRQSNQKNIGIIKSSNLCCEIIQYSDENETAVCNLVSICLPRYIEKKEEELEYNYKKLYEVAKIVTRNLNKVIDRNYYPTEETRISNSRHRPIGVGVQGLADVYCMLKLPYDSDEARIINRKIFETIYFGCLTASCELAEKDGPYETFKGSPFSEGKLQYHLWGLTEDDLLMDWDWKSLIERIKKHGTRNSLVTTVMPTATTSQIMYNNEGTEPFTSNMFTRTTLAGEYLMMNKHLMRELINLGIWNTEMRQELIYDNGSVQNIAEIPDDVKKRYKTAFEMSTKALVQQAVERGPTIDQSQSMNIFNDEPDYIKLTSSHFYAWSNKLKTGMYYRRTKVVVNPIKFGLDPELMRSIQRKRQNRKQRYISDEEEEKINEVVLRKQNATYSECTYVDCDMCGS